MGANHPVLERLIGRVVEARNSKNALDIRGGGTKQFYGNPPQGEPLEVAGLSGISSYEPTELVVTVLAGTRLSELEALLAEQGQCLPFEPPHFGAGGTVGGMVAAGLAGPARPSVGPLRDFVLGATLLNGMGELLAFGGQVMKNVAGYDVARVMAGSMGVLGVICEVSLKVMPVLPACRTLEFDLDERTALTQLRRWAGLGIPITASSWHRDLLRVRFGGAKTVVRDVPRLVGGREVEPSEAARWWSDLRDHRHEFFAFTGSEFARAVRLWRLAVPDGAAPIALPGERFIEWGGGQRWYRTDAAAERVRAAASDAGGHATLIRAADKSEGVFTLPSDTLMQIHRRLKHSFDPSRIFNPGRLYPDL